MTTSAISDPTLVAKPTPDATAPVAARTGIANPPVKKAKAPAAAAAAAPPTDTETTLETLTFFLFLSNSSAHSLCSFTGEDFIFINIHGSASQRKRGKSCLNGKRRRDVMEVDVLEFLVPVENNKTLFVWDIQPVHTEAEIYERLFSVFSSFGPLYLLKVSSNAPLHPPGFSALVKFYSAAQASEAQRRTDGRSLFQTSPLKVRLSSKQTPHFLSDSSRPLSHARCLELANHCLGFNGWTSDIITLKELTNEEEEEEGEGGGRRRRLRFGCLLQLSFPRHRQTTRGAAVVEDSFTCT
ncbi:RAD52 motif-containing protein 1 isoform X1, partial [Lates japonicus]